MKLLMLVNPHAGKKHGAHTANSALEKLTAKNINVEVRQSEYPGHLTELAQAEINNAWDGIVAVGGDGTLFEIINGMMRGNPDLPISLGVIPVGTGNSFSKDLDIDGLDSAITKIVNGKTRRVDLGTFNFENTDYYFINIIGFGFVSDVVEKAYGLKKWGALSYILGVLQVTTRLKAYNMAFEIDGQSHQRENIFVEICNSTKTGGDMIMAPNARIDDGLLDVVILNKLTRRKLLATFPKIFKGTHIHIPEIETFQAKSMTFSPAITKLLTPDGEILGHTPLTVSVLPGKIKVFDS